LLGEKYKLLWSIVAEISRRKKTVAIRRCWTIAKRSRILGNKQRGENNKMEPSDESLVQECRRGNQEAWESLVKRYERLIYTIPRRAGLDESSSADVFQTVFARLVEGLDRIDQPERIQAWLVTTARRETWRVILAGKPTRSTSQSEDSETIDKPDEAPLTDEALIRLEQQHAVRAAVDSLDEKCRRLVDLLFYRPEPASYSEIAEALGVTPGSIGPTRARCLQKLFKLLKPRI
jgi:RNA polymerase sigma factor (sigma-70 family)